MCEKACHGCALTDGAAANKEAKNNLTAKICVLGGIPFYCHEGLDWENPETYKLSKREMHAKGIKICQGWRREVYRLAQSGYYRENREAKRWIAVIAVKSLNEFVEAERGSFEKKDAHETLEWALTELHNERRKFVTSARV